MHALQLAEANTSMAKAEMLLEQKTIDNEKNLELVKDLRDTLTKVISYKEQPKSYES